MYLPLRVSREACPHAACFSNSRRGVATIRERQLFSTSGGAATTVLNLILRMEKNNNFQF